MRLFLVSNKSNLIVLKRWLLAVRREEEAHEVHGDDGSSADRNLRMMRLKPSFLIRL